MIHFHVFGGWGFDPTILRLLIEETTWPHKISYYPLECDMFVDTSSVLYKHIIVGWSFGVIAALSATQHSKNIAAMIYISGTCDFISHCSMTKQNVNFMHKKLRAGDEFVMKMFYEQCNAQNEVAFYSQSSLSSFAQTLITYAFLNHSKTYCMRTEPILLLHGTADKIMPTHHGITLHSLRKNCFLYWLNNAGHLPFLTHRIEMAQHINNFLTEVIKE